MGTGWWQHGSHTAWSGSAQTLCSREDPSTASLPWTTPPGCKCCLLGCRRHEVVHACVLSHSFVSHSLRPLGLQSARPLCLLGFSKQGYWSGLPCPVVALPNQGIEPTSPATLFDAYFIMEGFSFLLCLQFSGSSLSKVKTPLIRPPKRQLLLSTLVLWHRFQFRF